MAGNTFAKRQKERARQDKQKAKAERRLQRKQEKTPLNSLDDLIAPMDEVASMFETPQPDPPLADPGKVPAS